MLGKEFTHSDVGLVTGDRKERVGNLGHLLAHRGHYCVVRVSHGHDANSAGEVEEMVSIDIHDGGVVGMISVDGESRRNTGRNRLDSTFVKFLGTRARNLGHDIARGARSGW